MVEGGVSISLLVRLLLCVCLLMVFVVSMVMLVLWYIVMSVVIVLCSSVGCVFSGSSLVSICCVLFSV